jgi:hypothetical protein
MSFIEFIVEGEDEPREYIFTFGFGHVHPFNGRSLAGWYVRIHGKFHDARREMVARFGIKWAHQYASEEKAGVARYNLHELDQPEADVALLKAYQVGMRAADADFSDEPTIDESEP